MLTPRENLIESIFVISFIYLKVPWQIASKLWSELDLSIPDKSKETSKTSSKWRDRN